MKLSEVENLMGAPATYTGSAHRWETTGGAGKRERYKRWQEVAAALEALPKSQRIRGWRRGFMANGEYFVEIDLH